MAAGSPSRRNHEEGLQSRSLMQATSELESRGTEVLRKAQLKPNRKSGRQKQRWPNFEARSQEHRGGLLLGIAMRTRELRHWIYKERSRSRVFGSRRPMNLLQKGSSPAFRNRQMLGKNQLSQLTFGTSALRVFSDIYVFSEELQQWPMGFTESARAINTGKSPMKGCVPICTSDCPEEEEVRVKLHQTAGVFVTLLLPLTLLLPQPESTIRSELLGLLGTVVRSELGNYRT